jgi:hypothetical protein
LYNWFRWGGYLVWQLPEYPTFIDGRMNVWTTNYPTKHFFIDDYVKIQFYTQDNLKLVDYYFNKYNIRYALNASDSPISQLLLEEGWTVLYNENNIILLERKVVFANRN